MRCAACDPRLDDPKRVDSKEASRRLSAGWCTNCWGPRPEDDR